MSPMMLGETVRAAHRLRSFAGATLAGGARAEAWCALDATSCALGLVCAVHPRAADIDVGEALADIARLEAAARAVVDPERGAAAVACASWLALVLRPAVLEAAGWRRREGSHDAWVDPCAPEDLHDEASALHRVRKDLAA